MTDPITLTNRVVLSVKGPDAEEFLQGLLTQSTLNITENDARYGALLTPQGKLICDMIYQRTADGFLLDVPIQADEILAKRLNMFKLRADVTIALEDDLCVQVFAETGYSDPRNADLPRRAFAKKDEDAPTRTNTYHELRIAACVPEHGFDFGENEVFPADINMDLMNGVDFKKGCFIGQEVVSRMERRGNVRRRTIPLKFEHGAPDGGEPLLANGVQVGEITSRNSELALARVRVDRLGKAEADGANTVEAAGRSGVILRPHWLDEQISKLLNAKT